MRARITMVGGLVVAAVCIMLGAGQVLGSGAGPAAAASASRGWYIDSSGIPHYLAWRGESVGMASAYTWSGGKITSWYAGTLPGGLAAGVTAPAPAPASTSTSASTSTTSTAPATSTTTSTSTSTTATTSLERAPGLTTVTLASVRPAALTLAWTRATPPVGSTLAGYRVEWRPTASATWTAATSTTVDDTALGTTITISAAGLPQSAMWSVRVAARYTDGDLGPFSTAIDRDIPANLA